MGQIEILDYLRAKAEFYPSRRYTVKEILKGLKEGGVKVVHEGSVRRGLSKLSHFGFIDCETIGWKRTFKYVNEEKK